MVVKERLSSREFELFVLSQPNGQWELHCGEVREKPGMSVEHNWTMIKLGHLLLLQLDWNEFHVRVNTGHVRYSPKSYDIPDVCVLPIAMVQEARANPLEVYDGALPLVVEIWSPSTGHFDIATKLPDYQARGDQEIWRVQPVERSLTTWVGQDDGRYRSFAFSSGRVTATFLPNVTIDLAALFFG